jgi:glutathione peroxidase
VLGFPCNQFGAQEPGSDAEVLEFATSKYDANFPLFSKIEVNGPGACDLYQWLKSGNPDAEGKEDIAWNFTKFLIGRDGEVLARFAPQTTPEEIGEALKSHL